jgi:Ca2+-binding RTX toxin-like protein
MTTYYVAMNGSNNANGSSGSPFRTISKAMKAGLEPGDEVVVRSGTYRESVVINKDGAANNYITIRSEVPGGAKIDPPGNKVGVNIGANYVKVEGFEVTGSKTGGITAMNVHHVEILDNIVHHNQNEGIFAGKSDYLLIEGNEVYANAAKGGASGIHLKAAYNVTGNTSDNGFRIIIRDNVSYNNVTKFGMKTDGNGIILDDFQNTQISSLPPYRFKTLIEGNIVYGNFGRGIQAAWSDHVTIRDNIAMHNNSDLRSGLWRGELSNMGSNDNHWSNNIAISNPRADNPAIVNVSFQGDPSNRNVSWNSNTTFNGTRGDDSVYANASNSEPTTGNGNRLGVDPGLSLAELRQMARNLTDLPTSSSSSTASADSAAAVNEQVAPEANRSHQNGTAGNDHLNGDAGADLLNGGNGNDRINGKGGDDILVGGNGVDTLRGGQGDDVFVYRHTSAAKDGDVIADFRDGDTIDLGAIDANARASGNQDFSFIAANAFSGTAGELRYKAGVLAGDVNGDGKADFHIEIAHTPHLTADDFIL